MVRVVLFKYSSSDLGEISGHVCDTPAVTNGPYLMANVALIF